MKKIGNFLKFKDLFWQLVLREIKGKYKQSILGYAWVALVPIINLIVLSIIFSRLFRVPTDNIPYPIYLFVALVPWTFMSNAIMLATNSVLANSSLITKISLPREILPLSAVLAKLIDLLITSLILVVFLIIFGIQFQITLFYVPLILVVQLMLILGISFILSATNVFFRDVENVLGVALMIWMYMTPIIYSPKLIPANLYTLFYLNPMTGIVDAYRNVILYGLAPDWGSFSYSVLFSFSILVIGHLYFKNRSKYFADVI